MDAPEVGSIFDKFKEIGDKKKFVYDDDLAALVEGHITTVPETWSLDYLSVSTGNQNGPHSYRAIDSQDRTSNGSETGCQHRRRPSGRVIEGH